MDIRSFETSHEDGKDVRYITVAAGLHALLLFWNPTFLNNARTWRVDPLTPIVIVDTGYEFPAGRPKTGMGNSLSLPLSKINRSHTVDELKRPPAPVFSAATTRPSLVSHPFPGRTFIKPPFQTEQLAVSDPTSIPISLTKGPIERGISKPVLVDSHQKYGISGNTPGLKSRDLGGYGSAIMGSGRSALLIPVEADLHTDTYARQDGESALTGPKIDGPLAGRLVMARTIPEYPAWAEEQGIMASVKLYFTVTSQGQVRSNIKIQKTSGYPELDQLTIDALRRWRFSAVDFVDETHQWGIITFTFSLTNR